MQLSSNFSAFAAFSINLFARAKQDVIVTSRLLQEIDALARPIAKQAYEICTSPEAIALYASAAKAIFSLLKASLRVSFNTGYLLNQILHYVLGDSTAAAEQSDEIATQSYEIETPTSVFETQSAPIQGPALPQRKASLKKILSTLGMPYKQSNKLSLQDMSRAIHELSPSYS